MTPEIAFAIADHARRFGLDPAALQAVAWVESAGTFFWTVDGEEKPPIRPEVHKFYQFLSGERRDRAVREGLAHPRAGGVSLPNSWAARYAFFERMCAIDESAAIMATSWGIGQVMGFNWDMLGFDSPQELMYRACAGIEGQLELMRRYIVEIGLDVALDRKQWAVFAAGYNGPAYQQNAYDVRLKEAYARFSKNPVDGGVHLIQQKLKALGLYDGKVDGIMGPLTRSAVSRFQEAAGLVVDGEPSTLTAAEIDAYATSRARERRRSLIPSIGAAGAALGTVAEPVASALRNGEMLEAILQAQTVAEAVRALLTSLSLPAAATVGIVALVTGYTLYRLLARSGGDDKAARFGRDQ